uniref:Uncharacterized protein n=1 Tax=Eptatretus burgeri TaxID=7764 RepID=A0A8C4NIG5_EPTBU
MAELPQEDSSESIWGGKGGLPLARKTSTSTGARLAESLEFEYPSDVQIVLYCCSSLSPSISTLRLRVEERRACWRLATASGQLVEAQSYALRHLYIAREELEPGLNNDTVWGIMEQLRTTKDKAESKDNYQGTGLLRPFLSKASSSSLFLSRRKSQKYREEESPDPGITPVGLSDSSLHSPHVSLRVSSTSSAYNGEEFFDLLNRSHGGRTEREARDKLLSRSASPRRRATAPAPLGAVPSSQMDDLMELIARSQECRMNDQRVSAPALLGLQSTQADGTPAHRSESNGLLVNLADSKQPCSSQATDEAFFDMVMRCQGSRLDDQRCAPPPLPRRAPTTPDEEFLRLIQRVQDKDEQRVSFMGRPDLE